MTSISEGVPVRSPVRLALLWLGGTVLTVGLLASCSNDVAKAKAAVDSGNGLVKAQQWEPAGRAFFAAVEADPEYRPAHAALRALWLEQSVRLTFSPEREHSEAKRIQGEIDAKYAAWIVKYLNSPEVARAYGMLLQSKSDPRASEYLLKAVAHDPKDVEVWRMLSRVSDVNGDPVKASEYAHKAALIDPNNADDQYYYVGSLYRIDKARWRTESFELARRFPASERGAQALYWIAVDGDGDDEGRIAVYEQLLRDFPPQKFSWASSGAPLLFDLYLRSNNPQRAVTLATSMVKNPPLKDGAGAAKQWKTRERLAQGYVAITDKLKAGDARGARSLIDGITVDPRSESAPLLVRLKAQALSAAGDNQKAYETLLDWTVLQPLTDNVSTLKSYGKKVGRSDTQVESDLASARTAQSKPFPLTELRDFATSKPVSLSDYRGKVVLVSFWYPNCGPCRAEFPHIDSVVRGMKNPDLVYLAPNGKPEEDGLVGTFVDKTGYAFTPLRVKSTEAIMDEPKGLKIRGFPSNYIIDREGRIAYQGFMVQDGQAEALLKARIETLLRDKAGS